MSRLPSLLALGLAGNFAAVSSVPAEENFEQHVAPFLKEHCLECHGAETQKAEVRFDGLSEYRIEDTALWTDVYDALSADEMPPEKEPRPAPEARQALLSWIERSQRALDTGRTRRLNRREVSAALREVTGLAVRYEDALPEDGKLAGFDTGASALQDAADSVSLLLEITRRAVDGIRFLEAPPGETFVFEVKDPAFKDTRKAFDRMKEKGIVSKGNDATWQPERGLFLQPRWAGERDKFTIAVPAPADARAVVRIALDVSVEKPVPGLPNPRLWVEVADKVVDYREITGPQRLEYQVQIEDLPIQKGLVEIALRNVIEVPYGIEGYENEDKSRPEDKVPGGTGLFRPDFDRKKVPLTEQPVPFLVLESLEIEPDFVAPWPAAAAAARDTPEDAARLLGLWMERAYRRPVAAGERERFLALYRRLRSQEMSFDPALRAAFQSVLMSGPFRYLASPVDPDPSPGQHALASRLAFFLTGSPPDAALRALAAKGKLRDPAVLDTLVDRLLADPRSDAFFRPFVTQWLEMGQPITLAMDHLQKQDFRFGRHLKASMQEETIAYIARVFRENLPARAIVSSDWTMMNDILARHYGYPPPEGGDLRVTKLRPDDPRGGGILGHAGIQSMLCWMGENWVIYRGAWTLRHILNDPPPPPPLEVPELVPSAGENRGKTHRELLLRHQSDERCAICHQAMDPLGFAFQNFDLSGRWRELEFERYVRNELDGKVEWRGEGKSRPLDATGHLPRGEPFSGYAEFKRLVAENYLDDLAGGLMEKLLLYATGRVPDVPDKAELRALLAAAKPDGYPLRGLLKSLVRSKAFLER